VTEGEGIVCKEQKREKPEIDGKGLLKGRAKRLKPGWSSGVTYRDEVERPGMSCSEERKDFGYGD